jgi:hypothetical protein
MPKTSPSRTTFRNRYANANTVAAEERKSKTEKLNKILKLYLRYYNKDNTRLHHILDQVFLGIREILEPDNDAPDEDLYEYIDDLTEYVDDHINSRNSEDKEKLKQFARVKKVINQYSKQVLQAVRTKKQAQTLIAEMNNDDEMGNLISGMQSTRIRGGTRKVRKH